MDALTSCPGKGIGLSSHAATVLRMSARPESACLGAAPEVSPAHRPCVRTATAGCARTAESDVRSGSARGKGPGSRRRRHVGAIPPDAETSGGKPGETRPLNRRDSRRTALGRLPGPLSASRPDYQRDRIVHRDGFDGGPHGRVTSSGLPDLAVLGRVSGDVGPLPTLKEPHPRSEGQNPAPRGVRMVGLDTFRSKDIAGRPRRDLGRSAQVVEGIAEPDSAPVCCAGLTRSPPGYRPPEY
jgi:hypothetical protein